MLQNPLRSPPYKCIKWSMTKNVAHYLCRLRTQFKAKLAGFHFPKPCFSARNEVMQCEEHSPGSEHRVHKSWENKADGMGEKNPGSQVSVSGNAPPVQIRLGLNPAWLAQCPASMEMPSALVLNACAPFQRPGEVAAEKAKLNRFSLSVATRTSNPWSKKVKLIQEK